MTHGTDTIGISLKVLPLLLLVAGAVVTREADAQETTVVRPTVVVLPFDFAAPQSAPQSPPQSPPQSQAPRRWRDPSAVGAPRSMGAWPVSRMAEPAPDVRRAAPRDEPTGGVGDAVATLLVEQLLADGLFRVVERVPLDALRDERALDSAAGDSSRPSGAADYVVTGSVVEFGMEEKHALGGLGRITGLGGLGVKRPKTTVTLVARVVSARTGEVVLALRGQGVSRKGAGVTLGGILRGGGGIISVGSRAFRESALGEATGRAVEQLAGRLAERRAVLVAP